MDEQQRDTEAGATPVKTEHYKNRLYSKILRELSEEDLKNPAISKMIIEENESLKIQIETAHRFETDYHEADKKLAIQLEKNKQKVSFEILHDFCIALGGIVATLTTLDLSKPVALNNWIFCAVGLALIAGASYAKWKK